MLNSYQQDHCLYLDDLFAGQTFLSATAPISADDIARFACTFDPQPFHLDEDAAAKASLEDLQQAGGIQLH